MAVNKVEFGDQVVMDITDSTVSPEKLLSGETAYDRSGAKITGSLVTKDITVTPKRDTGENIATITIDDTDHDIYALSEEEVADFLAGDQEVEGNPVTLKTLIGGKAKTAEVTFLPKQDLHGYDNPWVGGAGKNKLQVTTQSYSTSGVTIAVNNGVLTLSNASTDNIQINLVTTRINVSDIRGSYKLVDDGSFTFSSNLYLNIRYYDSNGSAISNQALNSGKSMNLVIPNNATTFMPMVVIKSGVATNGTIKPMLMLQTETNLSFAPYENICPISGRDSVELVRTSKNMFRHFDPSTIYTQRATLTLNNNIYTMTASGEDAFVGLFRTNIGASYQDSDGTKQPCSALVGKSLRLVVSDSRLYKNYVTFFDKNSKSCGQVRLTNVNQTFEVPSGAEFFTYRIGDGNSVSGNVYTFTVMTLLVEEADLNYEPSNEEVTEIPLGATYYGGKADFVSGEGQNDLRIISENDFTSVSSGTTPNGYHWADVNIGYTPTFNISNMLPNKNGDSGWGSTVPCFGYVTSGTYKYMRVYCKESTLADFKTAYAGLQIVFSRETPATLTLTPTQIALLKGNNVVSTDGDNISLTWQNIPDIEKLIGNTVEGTLITGSTSLTLQSNKITEDSTLDIYTDKYGVNPSNAVVTTGQVVLTFIAQSSDMKVKVKVM